MGKTANICRTTCLGLSVVIAVALLVALTGALGFLLALLLSVLSAALVGMGLLKGICASGDEMALTGAAPGQDDQVAEAVFAPQAEPAPMNRGAETAGAPRADGSETEPETVVETVMETAVDRRLLEPDADDSEARDHEVVVPAAPQGLDAPRDGGADDLKQIKGLGPRAEITLNEMGIHHFAQIASWTGAEVAWVEENLKGFKGRVTRDDWVAQARTLLTGDGA